MSHLLNGVRDTFHRIFSSQSSPHEPVNSTSRRSQLFPWNRDPPRLENRRDLVIDEPRIMPDRPRTAPTARLRVCAGCGFQLGLMGTVETVVASLQVYRGNEPLVREGLRALCRLTRSDDVRKRILPRSDAIETVIQCLRQHAGDEIVQTEGARFVSYASMYSEANKTELAKGGAIGRLLSAAENFRDSSALCTQVCIGLRNVTVRRPDIVQCALRLNGVEGLLRILSGHGGAIVTSTHVLAGLYNMTGLEAGILDVMRYQGWEDILVKSALIHKNHISVQALCLALTGRIAVVGGPLVASKLVRCGAVNMALLAMHRFLNQRAVMYFGARLIRVLLEQSSEMEDVRGFGWKSRSLDLLYCTVAAGGSGEERYSGYADVFK